ncbi:pentapeptide repeat-containing protein, partial [Salmonella enterica subsp. enterica serovar Montevideo]|nr:pentapeptide repeat-containing protein [Salmonella enterica subsp. enterica serovar Montevideo]
TEREFIQRLHQWLGNRTLVVATHRVPILELVERVIVLKEGQLDANLCCANLHAVNLMGSNMTKANLTHADLTCANMSGVNLTAAI